MRRAGQHGREQPAVARVGRRLLRQLPALYVAAFAWAATTIAARVLPIGLLATAVLVIAIVIALYALMVAFVVFVTCSRFGIVRRPGWRRQAATIAVGSSFAWIL